MRLSNVLDCLLTVTVIAATQSSKPESSVVLAGYTGTMRRFYLLNELFLRSQCDVSIFSKKMYSMFFFPEKQIGTFFWEQNKLVLGSP